MKPRLYIIADNYRYVERMFLGPIKNKITIVTPEDPYKLEGVSNSIIIVSAFWKKPHPELFDLLKRMEVSNTILYLAA